MSRGYGFAPLAYLAKAKIIFDHTRLTTDDVDHVDERVLGNAEFGGPPLNIPWARNVYHLRSMVRCASHFAIPSLRSDEVYGGGPTGAIGQLLTSLIGDVSPMFKS